MKNNYILKFKIIFFLIFFNINNSIAEDLLIDAKEIDIKEQGNLILASGTVNISDTNKIQISGDRAKYNKTNEIVEIVGNVFFWDKEKNFKAKSDKIIYDKKNNIISTFKDTYVSFLDTNDNIKFEASGNESFFNKKKKIFEIKNNVTLKDNLNNYSIYSEKIIYLQIDDIFKSIGPTEINYNTDFLIKTKDINFNRKENIFYTNENTIISDNLNNKFELASFNFDLKRKIFKGKKIKLSDSEKNTLFIENGLLNLETDELIGSEFNLTFNKSFFGNPENDPRLIGRYISTNKNFTVMKKSTFTTCKYFEGKCPSWSISADEVNHKKEKKRIEYKNAWLEVFDIPIAYFPYFFHPDPTVERQSGFLFPQFINSGNLGFSTQIPYYTAIDIDKDLTISPRVYTNNNLFVQTEYRQAFKNSDLITDFSYNKNDSSNSHFFSSFISERGNSFYEMRIETVSNNDYLKKYQINSPLIENYNTLESSLVYEKSEEEYFFSTSLNIIEDLSKKTADKYEYLLPSYEFNKETYLENKIFDTFSISSSGNYRKFDTNVDEADVVNDFLISGENLRQFSSFETDLNFLLRNVNTYGDLSNLYKDNTNLKFLSALIFNLKYPLYKIDDKDNTSYFTPIASVRYSPNKTTNFKNENIFISYEDLFIVDRINNKTVESGISTTFGLEYINLDKLETEKIKLGLAVNFKSKEDKDIPRSTSLDQKTSDIIGYSGINLTENLSLNYDFSIDQNLSETNFSLITAAYNGDKLKTSFEYLEKSDFVGDESYLTYLAHLDLDISNAISFETNRNLDKNLTNYYNLIYDYKNDCLKASIVYNKQFYNDEDVNSGKNIFFKVSLLPFGAVSNINSND